MLVSSSLVRVFSRSARLSLLFWGLFAFVAQAAAPQDSGPEPSERATVFRTFDPDAIHGFVEAPVATKRMVDQLAMSVTGTSDVKSAWRSLVEPKDIVGIKVASAGGQYFSTHRGVVEAIVSGLEQAGLPRNRVIVWDRDTALLRRAGFQSKPGSYTVRGIDPPKGLDAKAVFFAPAFGRLMWGDLAFKGQTGLKKSISQTEQLSPESHLPFLLTREITKIINVATFSDEAGCGVAGTLYNVTVPVVDNSRRLTQRAGASSICDLYLDERIGPRTVIHFVDGLIAQFAAGPQFNPNYSFAHASLYASFDPVALDVTILTKLEQWRAQANLPPIGPLAGWLKTGSELGIGQSDPAKIDVQDLRPSR